MVNLADVNICFNTCRGKIRTEMSRAMEEIRWNFLKCCSQISPQFDVQLQWTTKYATAFEKGGFYHVFQRLWTFNISMITFLYVLSIIIFPNTTPSSSPHPLKDIHLHVELDGVHAEDLVADVGEHVARRDDAQPRGKLHHLLQKKLCVGICIFHRICIFLCICIWLWNLDLWFPLPLVWKITVGPELDCSSLRKSRVRISLQLDLKMRQFVMICDCFLENMTTHDNMRLFTGKYSNKQTNSDLL